MGTNTDVIFYHRTVDCLCLFRDLILDLGLSEVVITGSDDCSSFPMKLLVSFNKSLDETLSF